MIPHTPLSFAYHVTLVPPYREELHTDVRQALRRFEVEQTIYACIANDNPGARWDAFLRASLAIERAAYGGRAAPDVQLKVPMADAAAQLFGEMVPYLAWEVARGRPSDHAQLPSPSSGTLLECVYLLFYSSAFRDANSIPPSANFKVLPRPDEFSLAWTYVRDALRTQNFDQETLHERLTVLMQGVTFEYSDGAESVWHRCW